MTPDTRFRQAPRRLAGLLIRGYQRILSPMKTALLGPSAACRFHPTCSEYARQAIQSRGLVRGGWLALRRIGRCHPWSEGGLDPVPGEGPDRSNPSDSHGARPSPLPHG